ncbi:hypothetical protein ACJZ2D_008145 [Fusarium nematophilum]
MPSFPPCGHDMPFIVTTLTTPSVEAKRKTIRSHVMRGKNRKRPPPRPSSWIDSEQATTPSGLQTKIAISMSSIAPKVGGEFSFTAISAELGPEMLDTVRQLRQALPSLEFGPPAGQDDQAWFEPILTDPACFHFTVFMAKMYLDFVQGRTENDQKALVHHGKALQVLQQRIAGGDAKLSTSDSTVLVVVGLTTAAISVGDLGNAENHIRGLHKMVSLRGGLADLAVALSTGGDTLFFSEGVPFNSYLVPKEGKLFSESRASGSGHQRTTSNLESFLKRLDTRLRLIWDDLEECSRAINIATWCNLSIDSELYRQAMISVHYRLLHLRFGPGSVDETTRLGLLAFACSLFLQGHGVKPRYGYLIQQLKGELYRLKSGSKGLQSQLALWLYVICAAFVLEEDEPDWVQVSLTDLLRTGGFKSWDEVREGIKLVLWVDSVHDVAARRTVETALSRT